MTQSTKYYGICTTCNNAPFCRYSRDAKRPVWFCEMFNDRQPEPSQQPPAAKSNTPEIFEYKSSENKQPSQLKGLCVNCACRDTCTFPRPEGGVWHCAEYR